MRCLRYPSARSAREDSQLPKVWSQSTEAVDEAGEDDVAPRISRAGKRDTNAIDDDEDYAARREVGAHERKIIFLAETTSLDAQQANSCVKRNSTSGSKL
jgi:hypothetical protein